MCTEPQMSIADIPVRLSLWPSLFQYISDFFRLACLFGSGFMPAPKESFFLFGHGCLPGSYTSVSICASEMALPQFSLYRPSHRWLLEMRCGICPISCLQQMQRMLSLLWHQKQPSPGSVELSMGCEKQG